jgi:hypothetical protein
LASIVFPSLAMVAEPGLVLVDRAVFPDALVELVLQVGVALGERVAGDAGLDGKRDDGERAVRPFGARGSSSGVLPGGDAGAVVRAGLVAEQGGGGSQLVGDGLGDVRGLGFQGERAFAEPGGLLVGAMLPQPGTHRSRLGVSRVPSRWHRAFSLL